MSSLEWLIIDFENGGRKSKECPLILEMFFSYIILKQFYLKLHHYTLALVRAILKLKLL